MLPLFVLPCWFVANSSARLFHFIPPDERRAGVKVAAETPPLGSHLRRCDPDGRKRWSVIDLPPLRMVPVRSCFITSTRLSFSFPGISSKYTSPPTGVLTQSVQPAGGAARPDAAAVTFAFFMVFSAQTALKLRRRTQTRSRVFVVSTVLCDSPWRGCKRAPGGAMVAVMTRFTPPVCGEQVETLSEASQPAAVHR